MQVTDPPGLLAVARRQGGVITGAQAEAAGMSRRQVQRRVRVGHWRRRYRSVFEVVATRTSEAWAAVLAAGDGAVCVGVLAAVAHGLDRPDGPVLVAVPWARSVRGVPTCRRLLGAEDVTRVGGLPVTTPVVTVVDLLGATDPVAAVWTAEQALRRGLVTRSEVEDRLARTLRGVRLARDRWALVDARSESPLETAIRLAVLAAGLPPPDLQVTLREEDGEPVARLDMYWPQQRVAVEADGYRPHSSPDALFRDRRRQNLLQEAGIRVLRFTWADVRQPMVMLSQLRQLLSPTVAFGPANRTGRGA